MIKLVSAHIEEVRGIRRLDIPFDQATFAISGPNGSGKSGVIDAIEFALTGDISRLRGKGTQSLSVAEHGPHVDKVRFPDAAFVELKVYIPSLSKEATIRRKIAAPKKPVITPAEPSIKAILDKVAQHPEITLSRREILRFILVEPKARSDEIQAILRLDELGQIRGALLTAQNRLQSKLTAAESTAANNRSTLLRHLNVPALKGEDVLASVNARRKILDLAPIEALSAYMKLDVGLSDTGQASGFNKQSALNDLSALTAAIDTSSSASSDAIAGILDAIRALEADPSLIDLLNRRDLIEKGLDLVNSDACPLCDMSWESDAALRAHLNAKLLRSSEAARLRDGLLSAGATLGRETATLVALFRPVMASASTVMGEHKTVFAERIADLESFRSKLASFQDLLSVTTRLKAGWQGETKGNAERYAAFRAAIEAQPDQTAANDARSFLLTAQVRLNDYRIAMRQSEIAMATCKAGKAAYAAYCAAMDGELNALYESVEQEFSIFYKAINDGDELSFAAKLTPSAGKLDFLVNFYEKGLYPPAAFHSEGHQDGMGVCLYLALMKRLYGEQFTVALLDDVVMSVDADHRKQFCRLLKTHFPKTQFVITTHDRVWAQQMRSAGLVTKKTSLAFHGWTVDTGPLVESNDEIWEDIEDALAKNKVDVAAAALRRHLEYVSRSVADELGAEVVFRGDGNHELGELLPKTLSRLKDLYGKAVVSAESYGSGSAKQIALDRKSTLARCSEAANVENWALNRNVHYNEWVNFGRRDFQPVVTAFRELIDCFRCTGCMDWLHLSPRSVPETLRCGCNAVSLNLRRKEH